MSLRMRREHWIWGTIIAIALAAIGVTVFRSGATHVPESRTAERQRVLAHWDTVNTLALANRPASQFEADMLTAAWDRAPLSRAQRESLARHVAEFLHYRYAQVEPGVYRDWRTSRGYRMIDRTYFVFDRGFGRVWTAGFNEPLPDSLSMEQMFDAFWPLGTSALGASDVPVAIGTDPRSWSIAVGPMSVLDPHIRPSLGNKSRPNDDWIGIGGATMRTWFEPSTLLASIAAADGTVAAAEVGVLIEYKNGDRRPLGITLTYDNTRSRWWLIYVCQYNIPEDGLVAALEY